MEEDEIEERLEEMIAQPERDIWAELRLKRELE
jgi:hypothetical protein